MRVLAVFIAAAALAGPTFAFAPKLLPRVAHPKASVNNIHRALPLSGRTKTLMVATPNSQLTDVQSPGVAKKKVQRSEADWDKLLSEKWGSIDTDFMYYNECALDEEWSAGEIKPFGKIEFSPKAAILNYGQGLFEGMKAQRTEDGRIVIFRPNRNARRAMYGCERLCIPPVPEDIYIQAIKDVVLANADWVPPFGKGTLYIRALFLGTEPTLAFEPAPKNTFMIYVSPVGSYFKDNQMTPISLKMEDTFSRAAPGGSGGVKAIGNYAVSLLPQQLAKKEGFDNVLFLDAHEKKYIEEAGTSNIFVVKDNTVYTPEIQGGGHFDDTILEGVTRESVIQLAKDMGYEVKEERLPYKMMFEADEAFTVGTAVSVVPIRSVTFKGETKEWTFDTGAGPVSTKIHDTLTGIQNGKVEDKHGWTVYLN